MDAVDILRACGTDSQGLVHRDVLLAAGLSRGRRQRAVAAGRLLQVRPGVYAEQPLPLPARHRVRDGRVDPAYVAHVRAVLLSLGPTAAARSRTAAVLLGAEQLCEPELVEVVVPHGRVRVHLPGVQVRQERRPSMRVLVRSVPGTAPLRVLAPAAVVRGVAAERPRVEAVAVADAVLRAGLLSPAELDRAVANGGLLSARRSRAVVARCDPLSGSVLESAARVLFDEAGLHGWTSQHLVRDTWGRPLQRVDFCWRRERLVVEVDGDRFHADVVRDRRRDNELEVLGWRLLRFSWADVMGHPRQVVEAVRACLGR